MDEFGSGFAAALSGTYSTGDSSRGALCGSGLIVQQTTAGIVTGGALSLFLQRQLTIDFGLVDFGSTSNVFSFPQAGCANQSQSIKVSVGNGNVTFAFAKDSSTVSLSTPVIANVRTHFTMVIDFDARYAASEFVFFGYVS